VSYVAEDRIVYNGRFGTITGWTDGVEFPVIFDDEPWLIEYLTATELS